MASTRSKYVPIAKKKEETPKNEIRVTANGSAANYINRARFLFEEKEEKILLKASGNAIPVACTASEVLRHRIKGLAQVNNITNIQIVDEYEPKEEGLDNITVNRILSVLEITLTTNLESIDKNHVGYLAPLKDDQIEPFKPRGEGRGGDDRKYQDEQDDDNNKEGQRQRGGGGQRGGGRYEDRPRTRGGRGGMRPRGGYGGGYDRDRDERRGGPRGGDYNRGYDDRGYDDRRDNRDYRRDDREYRGGRGGGGGRGGPRGGGARNNDYGDKYNDYGDRNNDYGDRREYRGGGGQRGGRGGRGGGRGRGGNERSE